MSRDDRWDALRYSMLIGGPKLVEPVKINIPQPSAYECIKKLVENYEEKETTMEKRVIDECRKMAERYDLEMGWNYTPNGYEIRFKKPGVSYLYTPKIFFVDFPVREDYPRMLELMEYDLVKHFNINLNKFEPVKVPRINDVIFNDPATIVFWADGTKTVVKCQEGDIYDPEKGLAMAISKKALGNNYDSYNTFKKWLKKVKK